MMLAETICRIKKTGLMGIVRVDTIERGIEIAQGCIDGGVDVLEISYTNNNAGEVIRALKETFADQLLVGRQPVWRLWTARNSSLLQPSTKRCRKWQIYIRFPMHQAVQAIRK